MAGNVFRFFVPRLWLKQDQIIRARRYLRAIVYTFNLHTLVLAVLASLAVYMCDKLNLSWNMDVTLVAVGTTFPLVFTIQQAFTRREKAISLIANLKASAVALYYHHRDWSQDEGFPASLGNDHTLAAMQCRHLLLKLLRDVRSYLVAPSVYESYAEARLLARGHPYMDMMLAHVSLGGLSQLSFTAAMADVKQQEPALQALRRCYHDFSKLSVLNEKLTARAGYTRGGEGGLSRTNQYLRYIIANVEELRMLKEYRTPIMMRYANGVLLHIFAVALAPYFCHFCDSWVKNGYTWDTCPAGYSAAVIYVVIAMLLYNVQQDIEQPFDMEGLDDVFFEVGEEVLEEVMEPIDGGSSTAAGSPRLRSPRGSDACHLWGTGAGAGAAPRQPAEMLSSRATSLAAEDSSLITPGGKHKASNLGAPMGSRGCLAGMAVKEEDPPGPERRESEEQLIKAGTLRSTQPSPSPERSRDWRGGSPDHVE